jgi:hypothetical protein
MVMQRLQHRQPRHRNRRFSVQFCFCRNKSSVFAFALLETVGSAFAFVFLVVIPEGNLLFLLATAISSHDTFHPHGVVDLYFRWRSF